MNLSDLKLTSEYLNLDDTFFHKVNPTPLKDPHLVSFNKKAADLIGLKHEEAESREFVDFINGSNVLPDSTPYAMCYAGHQFGFYVPRLGDGRAINLGAVKGWHLQLKGAGQTRYSRSGDGRAVLRSSIREYLMSESMYGLGIPTTRALAIITSEQSVYRSEWEQTSIVLRMSPSWIRIGSFEYFYHKKQHDKLVDLADFVIAESYPHLKGDKDAYLKMFEEIVTNTAKLMAQWQAVGFNHGVMNTDNMSIASLTIDYGPYAFLDDYDFNYICNHTDREGRYSFGNQPYIGEWNLSMLLQALSPILNSDRMTPILFSYRKTYQETYLKLLKEKLGLFSDYENDSKLVTALFDFLQNQPIDYTLFFRTLSHYSGDRSSLLALALMKKPLEEWLDSYDERLELEFLSAEARNEKMKTINPKYVLKNYMLQEAIDRANKGDYTLVDGLLTLAHAPFDEHPHFEHFAGATPDKYKNLKLSCSS